MMLRIPGELQKLVTLGCVIALLPISFASAVPIYTEVFTSVTGSELGNIQVYCDSTNHQKFDSDGVVEFPTACTGLYVSQYMQNSGQTVNTPTTPLNVNNDSSGSLCKTTAVYMYIIENNNPVFQFSNCIN